MDKRMSINPEHGTTAAAGGAVIGVIKWLSITVMGSITLLSLWETALFAFVGSVIAYLGNMFIKWVVAKVKKFFGK
jgi:hypothetical protein